MIPKDVMSWSPLQWKMNLRYVKPSNGGAQGVVFVWDGATAMNNRTDSATSSFVIKPIQGSGSATKFAEFMLKKVGGASSPNSKPIGRKTPAGDAIVFKLQEAQSREPDAKVRLRWGAVMQHYLNAESFLLQETQQGIREFGDAYRVQHGLRSLLLDKTLMTNLGRLFAADAIIGNGDRLCSPNTGNIIFKPDGTMSAIDSSTVLTSYEKILADTTGESHFFTAPVDRNPSNWSKDLLGPGGRAVPSSHQQKAHAQGKSPVLPPGFGLQMLFDVDGWWSQTFRPHLVGGLKKESDDQQLNGGPPLVNPLESDWTTGLAAFKLGVEEGMRKIDSQLSGFNWLGVKSKYGKYVSQYGGDPNLDWTNLKIRRVYFKARKRGRSDDEAMSLVADYVKKKYPGI